MEPLTNRLIAAEQRITALEQQIGNEKKPVSKWKRASQNMSEISETLLDGMLFTIMIIIVLLFAFFIIGGIFMAILHGLKDAFF